MNCNEARQLIECYSDGELDAARARDIEGHLEICAVCLKTLESQRSLHRVLVNPELYSRATGKVSRDVRSAVKRCATQQSRPAPNWWRWLAIGSATVSIAAVLLIAQNISSRRDTLAAEITSSHVRSLLANHLTDVASEDRHTVKPWFTGKLDFAPPVKDLGDAGFVLIGGRMDYVHNRAVAALIYKHQQHVVNVFVWPCGNQPKITPQNFVRDGFNIVHWAGAQMDFWAISDLNRVELDKLQQLLTE